MRGLSGAKIAAGPIWDMAQRYLANWGHLPALWAAIQQALALTAQGPAHPKLLNARALVCPEELAKADMRPFRRDSAFDPSRKWSVHRSKSRMVKAALNIPAD
jgi:hypothetical protein